MRKYGRQQRGTRSNGFIFFFFKKKATAYYYSADAKQLAIFIPRIAVLNNGLLCKLIFSLIVHSWIHWLTLAESLPSQAPGLLAHRGPKICPKRWQICPWHLKFQGHLQRRLHPLLHSSSLSLQQASTSAQWCQVNIVCFFGRAVFYTFPCMKSVANMFIFTKASIWLFTIKCL